MPLLPGKLRTPVNQPMPRSRLLLVAGLLALAALLAVNVRRAHAIGMADHPPVWVVDAIPAAVSDLAFGNRDGYTSLKAVSEVYYASLRANNPGLIRDSEMVDRAMAEALKLDAQTMPRETVLLGGDDKGIVDFIKISFRLFGYANGRIIDLYFILLGGSILLLVLSFRETLLPAAIAGAFLVAHYLMLPTVYHHMQLQSVLALRFLPVLPLMACLHCLCFILRPSLTWPGVAALAAQASLLVFGVHLRSVTTWELAIVGLMGIATAFWALVRRPRSAAPVHANLRSYVALAGRPLIPGLCLLLGMTALTGYRKVAYDGRYTKGDQILTRPMWHNLLSGFAFNPEFARRYGFKIDDFSELRATGNYLVEQGREAEWIAMGGHDANFQIKWTLYDPATRDFLFSILRERPGASLATLFYHKPAALGRDLAWLYGFRCDVPDVDLFVSPQLGNAMAIHLEQLTKGVDAHRQRFILWDRIALLAILAFSLLLALAPSAGKAGDGLLALGVLALGSLTPTIVGYPALHTIAEPALMLATVLYVGAILGLSRLLEFTLRRIRSAPSAGRP